METEYAYVIVKWDVEGSYEYVDSVYLDKEEAEKARQKYEDEDTEGWTEEEKEDGVILYVLEKVPLVR